MATAEKEIVEVTATELKQSLGKYLDMVGAGKTVMITRNGAQVAKMADLKEERRAAIDSLVGIFRDDDVWSRKAAAKYYRMKESDVTDEQLADYYRIKEKEARVEHYAWREKRGSA